MTHYFSPSENAFYHDDVHGSPLISIVDPDWERPMIQVPDPDAEPGTILVNDPGIPPETSTLTILDDQSGETATMTIIDPEWIHPQIAVIDPNWQPPLIEIPDPDAEAPLVEVANPESSIPADAVGISEAEYQELIDGPANGFAIVWDVELQKPVLVPYSETLTLEQAVESKRRQIRSIMEMKMQAGIMINGAEIETTVNEMLNIQAAIDRAMIATLQNEPFVTTWTTKDDTSIAISRAQLIEIATAWGIYVSGLHATALTHRQAIAAMNSQSEVMAYDAETGWPEQVAI